MAFFNGLKRALGLPEKYEDVDADEEFSSFEGGQRAPYVNPFKKEADKPASVVSNSSSEKPDDDGLPMGIFDNLIGAINANLSPVVKNCIDVEAQKKYLYDTLGEDFQRFIAATRQNALSAALSKWNAERDAFASQLSELNEKNAIAENKIKEAKDQQLSVERQKRALTERTRELESRIATLEAEHEQFELENKSLLNKLKVSQVHSDDAVHAQDVIARLNAELEQAKAALKSAETSVKAEYDSKMEVTNALLNSLRSDASEKKIALENAHVELEKLKAELLKKSDDLAELQLELDEANSNLEIASEIQAQLDKVEDFKKKKTDEIDRLKMQLADSKTQGEVAVAEVAKKLESAQIRESEMTQKVTNLSAKLDEKRKEKEELQLELEIRIEELKSQLAAASDVIEQRAAEIQKARQAAASQNEIIEELQTAKIKADDELNRAKVESLEKTQRLEAEIAELQARLNVNGNIDDSLVDSDLRQAVEDTFNISLDDSESAMPNLDFSADSELVDDFTPVAAVVEEPPMETIPVTDEAEAVESVAADVTEPVLASDATDNAFTPPVETAEEESLTNVVPAEDNVFDEIDDIDWLIPTPPSKPEPEPEPEKEVPARPKHAQDDMQMSLF